MYWCSYDNSNLFVQYTYAIMIAINLCVDFIYSFTTTISLCIQYIYIFTIAINVCVQYIFVFTVTKNLYAQYVYLFTIIINYAYNIFTLRIHLYLHYTCIYNAFMFRIISCIKYYFHFYKYSLSFCILVVYKTFLIKIVIYLFKIFSILHCYVIL